MGEKNTKVIKNSSSSLVWVISGEPKIFFRYYSERENHSVSYEDEFSILWQILGKLWGFEKKVVLL